MKFDIIPITDTGVSMLNQTQLELLRTAQKKKNELVHKAQSELDEFSEKLLANGTHCSSLYGQKKDALDAEVNYLCEVIAEQLNYDLQKYATPEGQDPDDVGYRVDYSLSYAERYAIVRDYYLSISDMQERLRRWQNDKVAPDYLGSYYQTLYDYISTH